MHEELIQEMVSGLQAEMFGMIEYQYCDANC